MSDINIKLVSCPLHNKYDDECKVCYEFAINEHSFVSVSMPSKDYRCHVCGNDSIKILNCDNSCGDNPSVAVCFDCLCEIMDNCN